VLLAHPLPFADDHFAALDLEEDRFDCFHRLLFALFGLLLIERQGRLQQPSSDVGDDLLHLWGKGGVGG
jgi:hypothetical protein